MIDELKRRARAGDLQALQELRERGFFGSATAPTRSYEVSAAQRRMWILDQTSGVGSAYNISRALTVQGELDRPALGRAFNAIVERHESLRTTFTSVGDEPRQVVHPTSPLSIVEVDLRGEADPPGAARQLAAEDAPRPFDLTAGPLFRVHLLRTGQAEHVLLFTAHHIVCDAWSLDNIVRELTALYRGDALRPLPRQYKDFAVWHNEWLRSAQGDEGRRYWRRALAAPLPVLDLPTDHRRTTASSWAGRALTIDLGDALTAGLRALATSEGTTVFTALVAITKSLLHLESGQEDIIVGAPVAGRDQPEVEPLIGVFANAVALRDRVTSTTTVRGLVRRVRRTIEDAFAHQGLPFDEVVTDLAVERNASRSPIFDVLVGLLNTEQSSLELGGLTLGEFETATGQAPHDLVLYFAEGSGSLQLSVLYRTALFDEPAIRRLLDRWVRIAGRAIAAPESRLRDLDAGESALRAARPASANIGGADLDRLAGRIVREAGVADAVVMPVRDEGEGESLVAFVVPGDGAPAETVRTRVMSVGTGVTRVVTMSTLPLTGDGHVNVRTLERLADEALRPAPNTTPEPPLHVWDLVPRKAARAQAETPQTRTDSNPAPDSREAPAIGDRRRSGGRRGCAVDPGRSAHAGRCHFERHRHVREQRWRRTDVELREARRRRTPHRHVDPGRRRQPGSPVILLLSEASDVLPAFWGASSPARSR